MEKGYFVIWLIGLFFVVFRGTAGEKIAHQFSFVTEGTPMKRAVTQIEWSQKVCATFFFGLICG